MSAALDLLKDYQLFYSHYLQKDFLKEFPEYLTVQGNELQEWDKQVIRHYTGQGYLQLNHHLNQGIVVDYISSYRNILDFALDKLASHQDYVFRGISTNEEIDIEKIYQPGEVILYTGFISASRIPEVAKDFLSKANRCNLLLEIWSINGKSISAYSKHPEEAEVLFKSVSRFKVLSIQANPKDNFYKINMEEISHGATKS